MTQHTSRQYDSDMELLRERMLGMGALAVLQLGRIAHMLASGAHYTVDEIADTERGINLEHVEIDALCTRIIVKRQPAAVDLRHILSTIHIINDLERVGDESKKILHKLAALPQSHRTARPSELGSMAELTLDMLKRALHCIAQLDLLGAYDVLRMDAKVDTEYGAAMVRIEAAMNSQSEKISTLLDYAFIAKSLERCGDHAKNVAEEVISMVRGEDIRHRLDQNNTSSASP
jgi:phosphate transport system protein